MALLSCARTRATSLGDSSPLLLAVVLAVSADKDAFIADLTRRYPLDPYQAARLGSGRPARQVAVAAISSAILRV